MSTVQAWEWVFSHWHCTDWTPIDVCVKATLGLHAHLGMYKGMLVTYLGSKGLQAFISTMNKKRS